MKLDIKQRIEEADSSDLIAAAFICSFCFLLVVVPICAFVYSFAWDTMYSISCKSAGKPLYECVNEYRKAGRSNVQIDNDSEAKVSK